MESIASDIPLQLIIVSGASGSGKTQALKCLEDLGFFCVDNLPPVLFQKFITLCAQRGGEVRDIALGIDIRERGFILDFFDNLSRLKKNNYSVELLFLEASDTVLTRRFSESRRPHPLLPQRPVIEGIQLERQCLNELRAGADLVLDTSEITVHELRDWMSRHYSNFEHKQSLKVSLLTFGYKFGVPYDADMVFDVRFLRNPNYVQELKALTGEQEDVQRYLFEDSKAEGFVNLLKNFFTFLFPLFEKERRSCLTVAIGCTGGRHRPVAMALKLKQVFFSLGHEVQIRHRDMNRP